MLAQYYDERQDNPGNRAKMLKHYREAAMLGDTNAQSRLGRLLLDAAEGGQLDTEQAGQARAQAFALLEHAAKNDNRMAQWQLGSAMLAGRGMLQDKVGGRHWLAAAANQGHSTAAYVLARDTMYVSPTSPDYDLEAGLVWLDMAAKLGHQPAMLELAGLYEKGELIDQDLAQATFWAERASKFGTPGATEIYDRVNIARASQIDTLQTEGAQVAMAREDVANDVALLGEMPKAIGDNMLGSAPQPQAYEDSSALTLSSTVRTADNKQLMDLIGQLKGDVQRLTLENTTLRDQLAAVVTERDLAMEKLAVLDKQFKEIAARTQRLKSYQSVNTALTNVQLPAKAAPIAARDVNVNALNTNGMKAYAAGDYAKAKRLFEQAANAGNAEGTNNLATLYMRAAGADLDIDKAIALYEQASELGYAPAAKNLAFIYKNGEGVPADPAKASYWQQKAKELAMQRVVTRG